MKSSLALGHLGVKAGRSAIRWLRENGALCRTGEVIGFCSLAIDPASLRGRGGRAFAGEEVIQVVLATPIGGRLNVDASDPGGLLDVHVFEAWQEGDVVCHIQQASEDSSPRRESAQLRHLTLAGRRLGWPLDAGTGLLPGLYSRVRAWWGEKVDHAPTLLSLGICDATGFLRGGRSAFTELFESSDFPAHIVHVSEKPLSHCSLTLLEQLHRTPDQANEIALDLGRHIFDAHPPLQSAGLIFAGGLLEQVRASPLLDRQAAFDRNGVTMMNPADTIVLSLSAEPQSLLRHKQLGYHLNLHSETVRIAGPAVRAWLDSAFEPRRRSLSEIYDDFVRLADAVTAATGARLLVVNRMSTSGREDILSYAPFDAPMGQTLAYINAKEMNLMLHDIARGRNVGILDVDAIAAEIGGAWHLSDGAHQSEEMQDLLRREVLTCLAARAAVPS